MTEVIPERLKWWIEARFGMFIHWGLYSILARGEWVMYYERIPKAKYALLAKKFKPNRFDADEWIALAQEAGARYLVLTARHHDGFCLWDSQASDFTSVKTAAKRDFVGEYVDACHKAGMKVGLYYSFLDWRCPTWWNGPIKDPDGWKKFREYIHTQVLELVTKYGKIDILWYDGIYFSPLVSLSNIKVWKLEELNSKIRNIQPGIIINEEDYDVSEGVIKAFQRPWETCMTIEDAWWGYHPGDPNLKSSRQLIRNLVWCVARNGNYLLNAGPKADGVIPETQARRFRAVGEWLKLNGESIYEASSPPFGNIAYHLGTITLKRRNLYLHIMYWSNKKICIAGIKNRVNKVSMLATRKALNFKQESDHLYIMDLPKKSPEPIDTVIKIELEGTPEVTKGFFWE
jgi:alpha-L-fucosidase